MKASHWSSAAAIAAVGLALGLTGIGWGLPSARRVELLGGSIEKVRAELSTRSARDLETRRGQAAILATRPAEEGVDLPRLVRRYLLFSDSPDEPLTLLALANFRPRHLDFNPRMVEYGGLHVYGAGAAMALAHAVGFGRITSDVMHYADHPEDIARLYIAGRFLMALYNVGIAIVLYAFGRNLLKSEIRNQKSEVLCGWLAALLWLLSPPSLAFSHIINPHLPAAFWGTLAVWLAWRAGQSPNRRAWLGAAAASGAAASCALNAGLVFLAPVLVALFAWRDDRARLWRELGLAALVAVAMFLALNPYFFANLGVLGRELQRFRQFREPRAGLASLGGFLAGTLPESFGVLGLAIACVGGVWLWRRQAATIKPLLVYLITGLLLCASLAGSEAANPLTLRFATFLLPTIGLCLAAALASDWLRPWWGGVLTVMIGASLLGGVFTHTASFIWPSRNLSGEFVNQRFQKPTTILVPVSPGPYEMPAFDFSRHQLVSNPSAPAEVVVRVEGEERPEPPPGYSVTKSFPTDNRLELPLSFSGRFVRVYRRIPSNPR